MSRRSGLGKGLGALIPTEGAATGGGSSIEGLRDLPVSAIHANRHQPRTVFDEEALNSLVESVRSLGVLQPVLVRPSEDAGQYELIAGERRWRAARRAGLQTIPAVVKAVEELGALEQAVVENLHRADLNPLEEAAAYQQLIDDFGLTQEQAAKRVGKSRSSVANLLRLFQLPPTVQRAISDGSVSAGHAKVLLSTPDRAYQEALAKRIVAEDLSVRATEQLIREREELEEQLAPTSPDPSPDRRRLRPPGLLELEELLSARLDTRVKVEMGAKKGKMNIEFANLEDLERIYRIINSSTT
ncbi:MAG TPA: ParB/RepB/Spo0J family partition protein [Microthrixaceae bacterium]|nr:ParB/RepB/Spo0J family partition protein [Microthrixaceae bacterium]